MTGQENNRPNGLIEHAPVTLPGVDWVEIVHDELNVASGQIPRRLGFTEAERRPLDPPPAGRHGHRCGLAPHQVT